MTKNFALLISSLALFYTACQNKGPASPELIALNSAFSQVGELETPKGGLIKVFVAKTREEQAQGLSGVRDEQLKDDQGMLFVNKRDAALSFWMPETYFDQDIYFLDKNLRIISVERKVPHFEGRRPEKDIPTTNTYFGRHVLELKHSSPLNKELSPGDQLKVQSGHDLILR